MIELQECEVQQREVQQCEVQQLAKYPLGMFEVVSGALRISDPCYKKDVQPGIAGTIKAANGTWGADSYACNCGDRDLGERVWALEATLMIAAGSGLYVPNKKLPYRKLRFAVGVDSGQAGIFDMSHFQDESLIAPDTRTDFYRNWYGMCCHAARKGFRTLKNTSVGSTVPFGVVSSSGFGDGFYTAYVKRNSKGEAVAVTIVFIGEDEE